MPSEKDREYRKRGKANAGEDFKEVERQTLFTTSKILHICAVIF